MTKRNQRGAAVGLVLIIALIFMLIGMGAVLRAVIHDLAIDPEGERKIREYHEGVLEMHEKRHPDYPPASHEPALRYCEVNADCYVSYRPFPPRASSQGTCDTTRNRCER